MAEQGIGATDWEIIIERGDDRVKVYKHVPNDELEYGIDDALRDARDAEENLPT